MIHEVLPCRLMMNINQAHIFLYKKAQLTNPRDAV